MRLSLVALTLLLSTGAARASCLDPATEFSCMAPNGKLIQVCAGTEEFSYSYGNDEPAELELGVRFEDADVTPWPGIGMDIWSDVTFHNGDHSYTVWASQPRGGAGELSGGVVVKRKDREIARLDCDPNGHMTGAPELFSDIMTARGLCWNGNAGRWQREGSC